MATISSAGIGSGLDVNAIVTQLMAVERQPLNALASKASALDSKISAFGSIKSQLSSLSDATAKLALPTTWSARTSSSSNSAAVGVAVSNSAAASPTSFSIEVSQLARAQSLASAAVPAGSNIGSGTLSIQLGRWSTNGTPAFATASADPVSVTVTGSDTVSDIATKINAAGGGISATVLRDSSGERLLLRSSSTGEAAGFRIQAADDGAGTSGPGLATLAFDDPAGGGGMAANPIQYAQNANAKINGIAVTAASNRLTDTVPGLSLTLSQVTAAPVDITVSTDTASMRGAIDGFVSAYNSMNQMLNAATKYDPATRSAALLQGDSTTVGLQNALRSLVGSSSGGGTLQRLSDLGISIAKTAAGDLAVDGTKLAAALESPKAVQRFFANGAGDGEAATGFATRFSAFTRATIGITGSLTEKTAALQARKTGLNKDQDRLSNRLSLTEDRLRKQYGALDTKMSSLTALNNYISQQVAQWNRSDR
ncbi:MAG: flagellar filament capping protein FliD [Burkholderiaceae bacterium]